MPTLAIIHTSFALTDMLAAMTKELLPGVKVVNIVDDTLLSYARTHGVDTRLTRRMCLYVQSAVEAGADVVLSACSSVGETIDVARSLFSVPILKIDEPMAEAAVAQGRRIAVLATVASTLDPTCRLLQHIAATQNKEVQLDRRLCDGAFDLLLAGKNAEHDARLTALTMEAATSNDVVVFAQASMARLASALTGKLPVPLLTSPALALHRVQQIISGISARKD